ncbi:unnamed protein product [Rotaria magnacalcarata]|uniref:Uncharacterized protein n=1 Tax=Rotaria magnacalcarata TaxID=392030 RepID=A0A815BCS9_9BILA|nr:unnamed protein product [Rotaria magnacalcarata]CAF1675141.1 unnamed protein product [Rotaria magnacalcarata]CAF4061877.1 unnamed protein product [Rotaria magnacalcarata]CAF4076974.1 unnamed protein product [Rotaria magnacalcarata]
MILTIIVTVGFQTGSNITNAYGFTVCSEMIVTTILYIIFLVIDSYTWASNATKIPAGGWVAIVIGVTFFIFGFSWYFGQLQLRRFLKINSPRTNLQVLPVRLGILNNHSRQNSSTTLPATLTVNTISVENESDSNSESDGDHETVHQAGLTRIPSRVLLVKNIPVGSTNNILLNLQSANLNANIAIPAVIAPGVGCFLTTSKKHTPYVFENFLSRMHAIPQVVIFLQIQFVKIRTIENNSKRIIVKSYTKNIFHITAFYGYSENRIKPHDILLPALTLYNVPIPDDG